MLKISSARRSRIYLENVVGLKITAASGGKQGSACERPFRRRMGASRSSGDRPDGLRCFARTTKAEGS